MGRMLSTLLTTSQPAIVRNTSDHTRPEPFTPYHRTEWVMRYSSSARRGGQEQPRDRRAALHRAEHCRPPLQLHILQDRLCEQGRGRNVRQP